MADKQNMMIERLIIRRQFLHVAQGQKASGRFVLLQMRGSNDEATNANNVVRYGLTASKKVGNAVKRNRARRRLRAAMLELLPLYANLGNDYVAVARTATVTADWPALLDDLKRLFTRLSQIAPTKITHSATVPPAR